MQQKTFQAFLTGRKVYKPEQIEEAIKAVRPNFRFHQTNTKYKYFNVPAAFDIETSSFYDGDGKKTGIMYAWTFGIYGVTIFGRTWESFINMIEQLVRILDLSPDRKRLVVYVHNLAFDFQFFRKHFTFEKVFAVDRRKPLFAVADNGIEFRCSYLLSGYSLAKLGDELQRYKVRKAVGDLNYNLIRHQGTTMTSKEIRYCVNDVKVVMAYVMEQIEDCHGIGNIPYTKTGFVRTYCRNKCFYEPGKPRKKSYKRLRYHETMERLTLTPELYDACKRGFTGGFTHANSIYYNKVLENVASYDFTSSYPAVMIAERFPMGKPEKIDTTAITTEKFTECLLNFCCLFDVHFIGLKEKPDAWENYISESRCFYKQNVVANNGRIVSASEIWTTITDVDFMIIRKLYTWDSMQISNLYCWMRGYLPTDFVDAILKLYEDKTTLKGVQGKEIEYMVAKGMLNSCYGMSVTDIIREVNNYDADWNKPYTPTGKEKNALIEKYNKQWNRFLYYTWGIFVTAYARRNLFTGIINCGIDYVYSDTDSIKILNAEKHREYFEKYNRIIVSQLESAMRYHGFTFDRIRPKTIKGKEKPLGVWDYEGTYKRFKTLGAKRYLVEDEKGNYALTVAGVHKQKAKDYLLQKFPEDPFIGFTDQLFIPAEYTGKQTHTYIDVPREGTICDYTGQWGRYEELTGIHLESAEYRLSVSQQYKDYIISQIIGVYDYGKEKIL